MISGRKDALSRKVCQNVVPPVEEPRDAAAVPKRGTSNGGPRTGANGKGIYSAPAVQLAADVAAFLLCIPAQCSIFGCQTSTVVSFDVKKRALILSFLHSVFLSLSLSLSLFLFLHSSISLLSLFRLTKSASGAGQKPLIPALELHRNL